MEHPGFFERAGPFPLQEVVEGVGAQVPAGADSAKRIANVRPLSVAGPDDLTFLDNAKYADQLAGTCAAACLVRPDQVGGVPEGTVALAVQQPYHGFARAMQLFYPDAMHSKAAGMLHSETHAAMSASGGAGSLIDSTAQIEDGAVIEPGAVIGRQAVIGRGTTVAAGALVGYRVHVGRDCYVGPCASLQHALIGDRVVLHAGARIGQDGFGFAMGPGGHIKVPQIGRAIIQNDVEIGANSCVDRGALDDTIIGEGTKIDDLVMIGHNVVIGRHCVIVAQCGISGSTTLGDFVVMGGHAGCVGHITVGDGAQIAGAAHVKDDVPAGAKMAGTPARPFRDYAREIAMLKRMVADRSSGGRTGGK